MNTRARTWLILAALIAVLLGGAGLIVDKNGSAATGQEAPVGFLH